MDVRLEQPENAYPPILVMLSGMMIEDRLEQSLKTASSILVTLLGITIEMRLEQPENAYPPILVTLSGMLMSVRLEQP